MRRRDIQRKFLRRHRWKAVHGMKQNGKFKWVWIYPGCSTAYSREEAYAIEIQRQTPKISV
jgi:hypothetical protein